MSGAPAGIHQNANKPMKKIIPQISFSLLLLSALLFGVGRWVGRISDDTGDWFLWLGGIAALVVAFFMMKGVPVNSRQGIYTRTATIITFLVAFGTWGLLSTAGQKQFPEMAGLFPFYALVLAGNTIIVASYCPSDMAKKREQVGLVRHKPPSTQRQPVPPPSIYFDTSILDDFGPFRDLDADLRSKFFRATSDGFKSQRGEPVPHILLRQDFSHVRMQ